VSPSRACAAATNFGRCATSDFATLGPKTTRAACRESRGSRLSRQEHAARLPSTDARTTPCAARPPARETVFLRRIGQFVFAAAEAKSRRVPQRQVTLHWRGASRTTDTPRRFSQLSENTTIRPVAPPSGGTIASLYWRIRNRLKGRARRGGTSSRSRKTRGGQDVSARKICLFSLRNMSMETSKSRPDSVCSFEARTIGTAEAADCPADTNNAPQLSLRQA